MTAKRYTVLVAEDEQPLRDFVRRNLEVRGYKVLAASNGLEAMAFFNTESVDLVIVDLMMEEVDSGTAFVKELKLLGADVPIYLLSSVGDSLSVTTDYAALGLAGVFQKPIRTETLLAVLSTKLGG